MVNFNEASHLLLLGNDCSKIWVYHKKTQSPVCEFELNGTNDPLKVELVKGEFKLVRVNAEKIQGFDRFDIALDPTNKLCSTQYDFIGATEIQDERIHQYPNKLVRFPICLKKVDSDELHVHLISPSQKNNSRKGNPRKKNLRQAKSRKINPRKKED